MNDVTPLSEDQQYGIIFQMILNLSHISDLVGYRKTI